MLMKEERGVTVSMKARGDVPVLMKARDVMVLMKARDVMVLMKEATPLARRGGGETERGKTGREAPARRENNKT